MNKEIVSGKWLELKGDIQKAWGKLTNDELEQTKGDIKAITGLIQQKYGVDKDSYNKKLTELFERFNQHKDAVVEAAKTTLKS